MPALYRHLDDLPEQFRGGVVSIGNFDGVHWGHARIVGRLLAMARHWRVRALILTFDPHPAQLLRPLQAPTPLSWTERKAWLLQELGVDAIVAYPTDAALLELNAQEFFERIILSRLGARGLVEGQNFFFGHNRGGDIKVLGQFCRQADIPLEVIEPVQIGGQVVSSSRVRTLISAGAVAEAAGLLTQPYRIRGTVVRGQGRGNKLGYPTANVGQIDTLLPGEGIYAGQAWIDGRSYATAVSLGSNPTFDESEMKVEAFLLDYRGDLYGRPIEIDFLARLRDIKRFDSADQLVDQMALDVAETRRIAAMAVPPGHASMAGGKQGIEAG
jgi:riboflavin kinase / FMN adenylyltransferase